MDVDENNRRRKFWKGLKIVTVLLCFCGFVANSYLILVQFIGAQTVTMNDINHCSKYHCVLPSITICGRHGFKRKIKNYTDFGLDEYINNTVNLNEMLSSIWDENENKISVGPLGITSFNESLWKVSITYSAYRGRCYTIEYKQEVAARESLNVKLHNESDFWLYLHDKGEQYYLHYDFWPIVPYIHLSNPQEDAVDIVIRKNVEISNKDCNDGSYNYFNCLYGVFKNEIAVKNFTCTLPWIQSMLGEITYNDSFKPSCADHQNYKEIFDFGNDFSTNITTYKHTKCPAHCKKTIFDVRTQTYDDTTFVDIFAEDPQDINGTQNDIQIATETNENNEINSTEKEPTTYRYLAMYYATTDVKISTTSKLINVSTFISSVGGNLGLFVGFSFISGFFFIYNCLEKRGKSNVVRISIIGEHPNRRKN